MFTLAEAAETTTEHMTYGEMMVTLTTVILAVVTLALIFVSWKLYKATLKAVEHESDNMTKVAVEAIHEGSKFRRVTYKAQHGTGHHEA